MTIAALVFGTIVGGDAWAGGKGGGPPAGGGGPQQGAEEKARVEHAKQWATDIEKIRAQAPPPPLPTIKFPSPNEVLLAKLRSAEDPKRTLAEYLDKLWKDGKDAAKQRLAFEQFWRDAEKPKWARAATEDYFQKHANAPLKAAPPPPAAPPSEKAPEPATVPPSSPSPPSP